MVAFGKTESSRLLKCYPRGLSPSDSLHALSLAAASARSVRVARSRRSLARCLERLSDGCVSVCETGSTVTLTGVMAHEGTPRQNQCQPPQRPVTAAIALGLVGSIVCGALW